MDTNETKIYLAILIAAGILGVFLVFFVATMIRHHRRNRALYLEKLQAEIRTLENERKRIAADLHDDLGPLLSAVKMLIGNVDTTADEDRSTLDKANLHIDTILGQLHVISNNLMPQALIRKGLIVAVEELASERSDKGAMQIGFSVEKDVVVDPEQGIHLYRIIGEVIHNAEKHAQASRMDIKLQASGEKLLLSLKDNGKGFDSRNSEIAQRGLGLKNVVSRVETLKGSLYLDSGPEKGTLYTIEIPLKQSL
ncbi:MAG TPA: ATP-binding protein [Puia sp.]|nr:ATP-binding protein [Puia sp.]